MLVMGNRTTKAQNLHDTADIYFFKEVNIWTWLVGNLISNRARFCFVQEICCAKLLLIILNGRSLF